MSENGNKMSKNKKIAIFVTAALVVTIPATIGIMCYYKLGPFGKKPSAASAVLNKAKSHKSNVKPLLESNNDKRRISRRNLHANDSIDSPQTQNGEDHESDATTSAHQDGATSPGSWVAQQRAKEEFTEPFEPMSFDFEVNSDIKNWKAFAAYTKYIFLSGPQKYKLGFDSVNAVVSDKRTKEVVFTGTENIGIVHVIAKYLLSDPEVFDHYIDKAILSDIKDQPLVQLVVELACHIKMRKVGGKVSLREYHKYLHASEGFHNSKRLVSGKSNKHEKALVEAEIFNSYCDREFMFQIAPNAVEGIIPKEFFDKIIPPSENTR